MEIKEKETKFTEQNTAINCHLLLPATKSLHRNENARRTRAANWIHHPNLKLDGKGTSNINIFGLGVPVLLMYVIINHTVQCIV